MSVGGGSQVSWLGAQQAGDQGQGSVCGYVRQVPPTAAFAPSLPSTPALRCTCRARPLSQTRAPWALPFANFSLPRGERQDRVSSPSFVLRTPFLTVSLVLCPSSLRLLRGRQDGGPRRAMHARLSPCTPAPVTDASARVPVSRRGRRDGGGGREPARRPGGARQGGQDRGAGGAGAGVRAAHGGRH